MSDPTGWIGTSRAMTRTVHRIHDLACGPCYEVVDNGVIVDFGWIAMANSLFAAHSNRPPHAPFAFGVDVDAVIERLRTDSGQVEAEQGHDAAANLLDGDDG